MSKELSHEEYVKLRDSSINSLSKYIDSLPEKKAAKLAYWVKDYVRFLSKESSFDPKKLIRYKRGSVVKAHLGYRIGSEEGGLHYAIVIDNYNALSNSTATIIPLTSVKVGTDIHHLHPSKVYLGEEIYNSLRIKCMGHLQAAIEKNNAVGEKIAEINSEKIDPAAEDAIEKFEEQHRKNDAVQEEQAAVITEIAYCQRMISEIEKMKRGSIALIGQIATISKLRIYDPLYPSDVLSNIRISPESMDILDKKIKELFTYNPVENNHKKV